MIMIASYLIGVRGYGMCKDIRIAHFSLVAVEQLRTWLTCGLFTRLHFLSADKIVRLGTRKHPCKLQLEPNNLQIG